MQRDISCEQGRIERQRWLRPALGVIGGVLYVVMALVVMQVAFRIWVGMW